MLKKNPVHPTTPLHHGTWLIVKVTDYIGSMQANDDATVPTPYRCERHKMARFFD